LNPATYAHFCVFRAFFLAKDFPFLAMSTRYLLAGLLAGAAASPFANLESRTLPFGSLIYSCTVPNTVALTFDDGPFDYTEHVLDLFDQYDAKATFFLNGHNWGYMTDRPDTVVRMINEGHQVGSHTYVETMPSSHSSTTSRRPLGRMLKKALFDVLMDKGLS